MYFNSSGRPIALGAFLLALFAISDLGFAEKVKPEKNSSTETKKPVEGKIATVAEKPELVVQNGHASGITSVTFSPDGKLFASSGGLDNSINLWQVDSGKLLKTIVENSESLAFSPDSKLLASGAYEGVSLWIVGTGELRQFLKINKHRKQVNSVAFSPDGKLVASGAGDDVAGSGGFINIWRVEDGKLLHSFEGHSENVYSVVFSPDGKTLASGSRDYKCKTWSIESGKLIGTFEGHLAPISSVSFAPDGKFIITASWDKTLKTWEAKTGKSIHTFSGHTDDVRSAFFSQDSKVIFSAALDKKIKFWESKTGKLIRTIDAHSDAIKIAALSPDGKIIASGADRRDSTIKFWNSKTGRLLRCIEGHSDLVSSVAFSPYDHDIALASRDQTVRFWQGTMTMLRSVKIGSGSVLSVAYSPDGKLLASGANESIKLFDARTGSLVRELKVSSGSIFRSLIFSPDGNLLASGGDYDKTAKLWKVETGELIQTYSELSQNVSLAFSPDGKLLATGSFDGKIKLWQLTTNQLLNTLEGDGGWVFNIAFSPDGKFLASATQHKGTQLWEVATGKIVRNLKDSNVSDWSVAFSPHGTILASGSTDHRIRLWDIKTGKLLHTLQGHSNIVSSLSFSAKANVFVSGSWDTSTRLWSSDSGQLLLTLIAFSDGTGLVYTPDGRFDVSDEKAKRFVSYRAGDKFFDLVDVQKKYRVKGLLQKVLSGKLDEPESRIDRDTKHMPKLKMLYPDTDASSHVFTPDELSQAKFPLKFRPVDSGGGLSYAEVRLDGRLVGTIENLKDKTDVEIDVPLFQGMNRISITVKNKREMGTAENIQVEFDAKRKLKKPSLHFLTVGVNTYAASNKLSFARNDAEAMAAAIQKFGDQLKKEGVYENVAVHTLYDDQAFKKAIKEKIKEITKAAGREDVIMIYFSGHGASIREPGTGDKFYAYLPQDFPFSGMTYESLLNDGVHGKFLEEQLSLKNTQAKKVVLILDTCQSGDIATMFAMKKSGQESDTAVLSDLVAGSGIFVLASSAGEQVSRESDKINHGVFTQVLLDGLVDKKADTNNNGIVTIVELGNYLRVNVDAKLKEVFGKQEKQTPRIVEMGRDDWSEAYNDFPLARVR